MSILDSKYTQKILKFLDENGNIRDTKYTSPFIEKITNIYNEIAISNNIKIELIKDVYLDPINNRKNYPLLYTALSDLEIIPIQPFDKFLSFFREKFSSTSLENLLNSTKKELISKRDQYYNLFFNPMEDRKVLHYMMYKNSFVSLDIIHCGETEKLRYQVYKNKNTEIHVYNSLENDSVDIKKIIDIVSLFRILDGKNKNVTIAIFLCNQKKYLPRMPFFTAENINSGCSRAGKYVLIYRKEEFYKVLIHELIHYFNFDFSSHDCHELMESFHSLVNVNGRDVINEAYTEILAVTINSIINSIYLNIEFSTIINYEISFTHFQIAKIIFLFGGKKYLDLFKIEIKQNTSVASYIIAKGILLSNYDKVLNYFNSLSENEIKNYNSYKILYTNLMNEKALDGKLIDDFLNIIERRDKTDFIMKTSRMVVFA
jgi:hypothetical protein